MDDGQVNFGRKSEDGGRNYDRRSFRLPSSVCSTSSVQIK